MEVGGGTGREHPLCGAAARHGEVFERTEKDRGCPVRVGSERQPPCGLERESRAIGDNKFNKWGPERRFDRPEGELLVRRIDKETRREEALWE